MSSARVVRCWVKSRNERNPRRVLPSGDAGNPRGTAAVKAEEDQWAKLALVKEIAEEVWG